MDLFDDRNLKHILTFHPAKDGTVSDKLEAISGAFLQAAKFLGSECPACAERTLALRRLEEAGFWARAAIERNQGIDDPAAGGS